MEARNVEVVRRYYDACNAGNLEALLGTLTPDAAHYFLPGKFAPVRGAGHFARYWVKNRNEFDARWTVDHVMAQGDEVVVEWSMFWAPKGAPRRIVTRGAEWYVMRDGRIAEVRAYFIADAAASTELAGFPYAQRGYPAIGA
jgi:ketosteroid isomerase-like protein